MQDRSAPFDSWCRLNSRHSQCGQRCSKPSFRFEPALPSSRLSNSSGKDSEGWKYGAWRIEIFLLNIWRLRIQARFSLNSLYEMTIPRIIPIFTVRNIWTPSNRSRDWGPWTENVRNARHQMQTSTWLIRLLWDAYIASLELKEILHLTRFGLILCHGICEAGRKTCLPENFRFIFEMTCEEIALIQRSSLYATTFPGAGKARAGFRT